MLLQVLMMQYKQKDAEAQRWIERAVVTMMKAYFFTLHQLGEIPWKLANVPLRGKSTKAP